MKVSKPKVTLLAQGEKYKTKRMQANAGELLPKHKASVESVLVVTHGACNLNINNGDHRMNPGDVYVIPAEVTHQIKAIEDLSAIHIMPHDIKFEFFT